MSSPDLATLVAPERRTATEALRQLEEHLRSARAVELYGAAGSLGAALAARLAATRAAGAAPPLVYVCADEETAEARLGDLTFFLPGAAASDEPLAPPPALQLPVPQASPYAEMQADRRNLLRRMAVLFRLTQGFAPAALVTSSAALFRRVIPRGPFDELCDLVTPRSTVSR